MAARQRVRIGRRISRFGPVEAGGQRLDPGIERRNVLGSRDVQALEHALDPVVEGLLDLVPGAGRFFAGLAQVFLDVVAPARGIPGLLTVACVDGLAFADQVLENAAAFRLGASKRAKPGQPDLLRRVG